MNRKSACALLLSCLALWGCSKPVPADKAAYVGEWRSREMSLLITADGTVHYLRYKGGGQVKVTGPLREFKGDDFVVGVPFVTTTFVVSRPPQADDGKWKMVVDGVELTRIR